MMKKKKIDINLMQKVYDDMLLEKEFIESMGDKNLIETFNSSLQTAKEKLENLKKERNDKLKKLLDKNDSND